MSQILLFALLREVSNNDQAFIRRMIASFVNQVDSDLPQIRASMQNQQPEILSKICHRLKSSLNYMDLHAVREKCIRLEIELRAGNFPMEQTQDFFESLEIGKQKLQEVLNREII